jgi:hypothetical protein
MDVGFSAGTLGRESITSNHKTCMFNRQLHHQNMTLILTGALSLV